ncbi:hypothetical protein B0H11DRAFT_850477 [Mycena galericulata]|nr:hypothetical protein B0H11DRAFT_850477 [Mycena galericulata]
MSAAARAEARRKAILSRGTDRLAKLTTTGRGDDAAYAQDAAPDPPLPSFPSSTTNLSNFVGEETAGMPRPRSRVPSRTNNANNVTNNVQPNNNASPANPFGMPDPSAWSQDQQAQFLQAFMGGGPLPGITPGADGAPMPPQGNPFAGMEGNPFAGMEGNPLAALMGAGGAGGAGAGFPPFGADVGAGMGMGMGKAPDVPPPKTRMQRLLPVLHFAAVWALIAYFVIFREPAYYEAAFEAAGVAGAGSGVAWRWRQLAGYVVDAPGGGVGGWGVQVVPFFWAFVTLELVLHSLRIFSGFDAWRPPTLLALALPHLPPPIPSVIVHSMKYLQMGSLFLDDVAAVIVGIGLVIWLATWRAA